MDTVNNFILNLQIPLSPVYDRFYVWHISLIILTILLFVVFFNIKEIKSMGEIVIRFGVAVFLSTAFTVVFIELLVRGIL
jgi:hypothetical protein